MLSTEEQAMIRIVGKDYVRRLLDMVQQRFDYELDNSFHKVDEFPRTWFTDVINELKDDCA